MRARVRAAWRGARLAAPAFPVRCTPGDNLAIHVAVAQAPAGSALAVDVGDEDELGYWGEVLTTAAEARGIAGLVIDGGVRDTAALEAHGFPVFSTTVALRGASKRRPGAVGAPVEWGGERWRPGTGSSATATAWRWCRRAAIEDVLARGPGPRRQGVGHVQRPPPRRHDPRAPRARPVPGGGRLRPIALGRAGLRR